MNTGTNSIVVPVRDLAAAKAVYGALLGEPHTDQPYYVGYRLGDHEVALDPNGHKQGMTGPVSFWDVDDIEKTAAALVEAGGTVAGPARDVGGGMLVAIVADADGNPIGLRQQPA
jgi:predicted enzyme related to lactoylglutathione lyase